jgi:hypothetical protein
MKESIESVVYKSMKIGNLCLSTTVTTGESTQTAWTYAVQYRDKIRYLEHEKHQNRGASASRNLGIRFAKGEYIRCWTPSPLHFRLRSSTMQPSAKHYNGNFDHTVILMAQKTQPESHSFRVLSIAIPTGFDT